MSVRQQKMRRRVSATSGALVWCALLLSAPVGIAQTLAKPVLTPAAPPAPASSDQAQAAPAVEADASSYVIGPDDSLQVAVWQQANLSGTFPVRPDGKISLALVGDIQAAGLTPMHLAHDIQSKLKKYIQDPLVSVVVAAVKSQRVYLIGQVGHTGPIVLAPGMTPLQAIAEAGGLSPFSSGKKIYILRGPQGKQQKIPFNYKLALKGDNRQDVSLLPGDTIVVP
jgi:polysaccharide export outer membrane protein